jgi:hypothetical protein
MRRPCRPRVCARACRAWRWRAHRRGPRPADAGCHRPTGACRSRRGRRQMGRPSRGGLSQGLGVHHRERPAVAWLYPVPAGRARRSRVGDARLARDDGALGHAIPVDLALLGGGPP